MKVIIESINLNQIETTAHGDNEFNFIKGKMEVDYVLINGFNKLSGKMIFYEHIDSICLIEQKILEECQNGFGKTEK